MNLQITSHTRPAFAGLLLVLTASTVLAQVKTLNVLGSIDGHDIGVVQGGTLQGTASGAGSASHIGQFNFALSATVNLDTGNSSGVFLLNFSNGDVIYGSFIGHGGPTAPFSFCSPNPGEIVEHLTIDGGTGRFQGATGSLTFDRCTDRTTVIPFDSNSGTVKGTISTSSSTK